MLLNKIKDKKQIEQIIQLFIDNKQNNYLYEVIKKNKTNHNFLTQQQKEVIKQQYPNIKFGYKLIKIAKILKES